MWMTERSRRPKQVAGPDEVDRVEEAEDEPVKESDGKPTEPEQPREPATLKARQLWATLLFQAREIELPGAPTPP